MAYTKDVANIPSLIVAGILAAYNELLAGLIASGKIAHHKADTTNAIATADASDLATLKALVLDMAPKLALHGADTEAHTAADTIAEPAAWTANPAVPVDLTECQNILNELKTDWNAHIAVAAAHRSVLAEIDANGVLTPTAITTANATDQATSEALANALKSAWNIHMASAGADIVIVDS